MTLRLVLPLAVIVSLALLPACGGGGGDGPTNPPPGGNRPPTVNLNINQTVVAVGGSATVTAATSDPDGDQVTLAWSAKRGSVSSSGQTATTATYTASTTPGQDSVVVVASDGKGGTGRGAAGVYVQNPGTPAFTLGMGTSSTCGYGTSNPDGFLLTITPSEDVLVSYILIKPRDCASGVCERIVNYSPKLALAVGQTYTWTDGTCRAPTCCQNSPYCGNCGYWTIAISGNRPAPDGSAFTYECYSWAGPGDDCR